MEPTILAVIMGSEYSFFQYSKRYDDTRNRDGFHSNQSEIIAGSFAVEMALKVSVTKVIHFENLLSPPVGICRENQEMFPER